MTEATYRPDLYPTTRYEDALAGIAWLEEALGFERHLVVPGENGKVMHAELRLGRGFLMLGSDGEDVYRIRSPRALGGANTHAVYVAADDVALRYERAKRAGARFERELETTDYGSTEFAVRDPEGHSWSVGSYHPAVDVAAGETAGGLPPELYATVRYVDARRAIAFLERGFGATTQFLVPGEGESVAHAQLRFGSSLVMLASHDGRAGVSSPGAHDGVTTGGICVAIDDVDALFGRAVAAGAEVVTAPHDAEYGARMMTLRDLEGGVWTFGTYRPTP